MDDRSLYHTLAGRYGCGAGNVVGSSSCSTLYFYTPNSFESVALDVPAGQPSTTTPAITRHLVAISVLTTVMLVVMLGMIAALTHI